MAYDSTKKLPFFLNAGEERVNVVVSLVNLAIDVKNMRAGRRRLSLVLSHFFVLSLCLVCCGYPAVGPTAPTSAWKQEVTLCAVVGASCYVWPVCCHTYDQ